MILSLPTHLTLHEAHATLRDLEPAIAAANGPLVTLDAAALTEIDTSALAVLLECRRIAQGVQRHLQIVNAPSRLTELAALYGVLDLLDLQRPA